MVMGTITRTSEVRPELIIGSFTCMDCRISNQYVPQQFKYTVNIYINRYIFIKICIGTISMF